MVGRHSWRARSGWEAIIEGRERSRGHNKGLGVVGRPSLRFVSGQEAITEGWEAFPKDGDWSEGPPGGREWLGDPHRELADLPAGPGIVGRPAWRAGNGLEALLEGCEWSGGHHKGSRVVGRPDVRVGSNSEVILEGREWLGSLPG